MLETFITQHWCIAVALAFIAFDILTGIVKALRNKELSSTVARKGLYNKVGFLLAIAFGALCEISSQVFEFPYEVPLTLPICGYVILLELLSIVENICVISPELDKYLGKFLAIESDEVQGE